MISLHWPTSCNNMANWLTKSEQHYTPAMAPKHHTSETIVRNLTSFQRANGVIGGYQTTIGRGKSRRRKDWIRRHSKRYWTRWRREKWRHSQKRKPSPKPRLKKTKIINDRIYEKVVKNLLRVSCRMCPMISICSLFVHRWYNEKLGGICWVVICRRWVTPTICWYFLIKIVCFFQ